MAKLGTVTLQTEIDLDGLDKGLDQGQQTSKNSFQKMGVNAKDLFAGAVASAALLAANAIKDFAMESLDEFQAFEHGAAEVFTLLPDITQTAMDSMKDDVLSFSVEAGRTSDEVLPALYQALSAGVPQDNVFEFMEVASDAARGGVTDLETAVDGITSVVNAYGDEVIDAASASDVMFTAVRLGKTNFEQLSGSLFNVIPTAASLGVSFEDVAASLAALTAQGTPTSVATTQLRQAFVEASKTGTGLDMALRDLVGGSFPELIAKGFTSQEIFTKLRNSMPEQAFRDLFGSVEASNAVLGITSETAQGIIEDFGTLEDTIGATAAAADTMAESLETMEGRLAASDEALKIQSGQAIAPLKKSWIDLRLSTNEYFAEDLARRNQIEQMTAALEAQGITGIDAQKIINQLGEGTTVWRDSMADADVMARRYNIALELLEDGHSETASRIYDSVLAIEEQESALGTTSTVSHRYAQSQSEAAGAVDELTEAATGLMEITASGLTVGEIEEQQRGRLIDLYASSTATQNDERDAIQEVGDSTERLNEILDKRAIEEARVEAAAEAAAEAQRFLLEQSGDLFTAFSEGNQTIDASGSTLLRMADAGGASAEQMALLAVATGEMSEAQATALIQQVALEQSLAALGGQYASGAISLDDYVEMANKAVVEVQSLTVEQNANGEANKRGVETLELLGNSYTDQAAKAGLLTGATETASGSLSTLGANASSAAKKLTEIPTKIDVHIGITSDPIPAMPSANGGRGNTGGAAFMTGGYTGNGAIDEIAGIVHAQELVIPADVLNAGSAAILDFAEKNVPTGVIPPSMAADVTGTSVDKDQIIHDAIMAGIYIPTGVSEIPPAAPSPPPEIEIDRDEVLQRAIDAGIYIPDVNLPEPVEMIEGDLTGYGGNGGVVINVKVDGTNKTAKDIKKDVEETVAMAVKRLARDIDQLKRGKC